MSKKISILTALAAAVCLSSGTLLAVEQAEKCKVVDKDGKGLIKANQSDCSGANHSCAGENEAGDPNAWILVPKGECEKINAGDFSGVGQDIKDRIDGAK